MPPPTIIVAAQSGDKMTAQRLQEAANTGAAADSVDVTDGEAKEVEELQKLLKSGRVSKRAAA